jgi:hypothetical protein
MREGAKGVFSLPFPTSCYYLFTIHYSLAPIINHSPPWPAAQGVKLLLSNLDHAERQLRCGMVCALECPRSVGSCSGCESFQALGATRETWGQCCQCALQREEYNP